MTEDVIALLREAVAIPSVTPAQTTTTAHAGEQRMAEWFADQLEDLGFDVAWQHVAPGRPNIIGRYGPAEPRHTLMFESHLDTVGIEGMEHEPFAGAIREGRLYGRGASDCKGALAAALAALARADLQALARSGVGLVYVGAMGEETGHLGARACLEQFTRTVDQCVVLEPTGMAIVHAHKGICWFGITLTGRSAHASNPEEGLNPVPAAMEFVQALYAGRTGEAGRTAHSLLGSPTINVGCLHAGMAPNVVPASCRIELDWRTVPPFGQDDVMAVLHELLEPIRQKGACLDYTIECLHETRPLVTPAESPLVRSLCSSLEAQGLAARTEGAAWCSDAAVLAACCRHVVVFGPGSIKQAHASTEFLSLDELGRAVDVLTHWLNQSLPTGTRAL